MSTEQSEKAQKDAEMLDNLILAVIPSVIKAHASVYKNLFPRDIAASAYSIANEVMKYRERTK